MSFFTLYVSVLGTIFVLNAIVNTLLKCYEISTRFAPNENENNEPERSKGPKALRAEEQIPENIHKSMYS